MSVPETMEKLVGRWRGLNRLHTTWIPENPVRETVSRVLIEQTARGRFLKIEYDWTFEETLQEGLILIGTDRNAESVKTFWIDSWHMGDKFMVSEGGRQENGAISVKGFYAVPDHPDWGWRTVFEPENENSFKITMFNVTPEGEESPAVEMQLQRQS